MASPRTRSEPPPAGRRSVRPDDSAEEVQPLRQEAVDLVSLSRSRQLRFRRRHAAPSLRPRRSEDGPAKAQAFFGDRLIVPTPSHALRAETIDVMRTAPAWVARLRLRDERTDFLGCLLLGDGAHAELDGLPPPEEQGRLAESKARLFDRATAFVNFAGAAPCRALPFVRGRGMYDNVLYQLFLRVIRMAKRPTSQTPQPPILSPVEKRNAIDRLTRKIEEVRAFEPMSVQARRSPQVMRLETAIEETLATIFGQRTDRYNRYRAAADFEPPGIATLAMPDWIAARGGGRPPDRENIQELRMQIAERKQRAIVLLEGAVEALEEELQHEQTDDNPSRFANPDPAPRPLDLTKVFIVHGHDGAPKAEVARFIEKLGFEAIILHERPNKGRTIITKFREEADGVGFAVVLMTPDDLGRAAAAADLNPRARQNVVFELGFFIGQLKPERVAALVKGNIEKPSDFDGVVYISLDSADWHRQLGQELQEAGYVIDWNRLMRP